MVADKSRSGRAANSGTIVAPESARPSRRLLLIGKKYFYCPTCSRFPDIAAKSLVEPHRTWGFTGQEDEAAY